jgi:multidrug efflux pump subunit AcrB
MSKLVKKSSEHAKKKQTYHNANPNHLKRVTSQLTHESLNRAIGLMVIAAILVGVSLILVLFG